jgi:Tfp pilus assembly protein PilV
MGKLKASTILETIIAMLIIFIVFLTAGMIFINVLKTGLSEKKIKASVVISNYLDQLKIENVPSEITDKSVDFIINTTIETYKDKIGVVLVNCQVYDFDNKIIAERKRVMLIKN